MGAAAARLRPSAPRRPHSSAPPLLRAPTAEMAPSAKGLYSASRRAAELKFSPCGEQFGCIEAGGSLCLWRFQSGTDAPLPFSRLQCHGKCGADLCFVGTSVVVATVGQSVGLSAPSLCLWDVLLPPSQALVTSCAAHSEGGCCVLYSPSDMSLISGRSMATRALCPPPPPPSRPCGHPPLQRPTRCLRACPSGPERGRLRRLDGCQAGQRREPGAAPKSPLPFARDHVDPRPRPHPHPRWWAEGRDGHLRLAAAAAARAVERALARDPLARARCAHGALLLRLLRRGHEAVRPRACNPMPIHAHLAGLHRCVIALRRPPYVRPQPCVIEAAILCAQVGSQAISPRRRLEPARPRRRACGRRAAAQVAGLLAQGARAAHDAARRPRAADRPHLRGGEAHPIRTRPAHQRRLRRRVPRVAHSSRSLTRPVVKTGRTVSHIRNRRERSIELRRGVVMLSKSLRVFPLWFAPTGAFSLVRTSGARPKSDTLGEISGRVEVTASLTSTCA